MNNPKSLSLVVLGPPGAGKGTQAPLAVCDEQESLPRRIHGNEPIEAVQQILPTLLGSPLE